LDNVKLVLGGFGYLEKRVKSCITDMPKVLWVGFVPGKKLIEYNLASDIMVVLFNPSRQSQRVCLPNKLFEAMAAGKPIIVCKGTEAAKIVEKEGCGLVVPYGNREALRGAIVSLTKDNKYRKELGKKGLAAAKKMYNWQVQESRLLEIYNDLAKSYNIS
jgi:glycosyltransferase involved in cell wall biosynthesis